MLLVPPILLSYNFALKSPISRNQHYIPFQAQWQPWIRGIVVYKLKSLLRSASPKTTSCSSSFHSYAIVHSFCSLKFMSRCRTKVSSYHTLHTVSSSVPELHRQISPYRAETIVFFLLRPFFSVLRSLVASNLSKKQER
jgi:hypothetical protein